MPITMPPNEAKLLFHPEWDTEYQFFDLAAAHPFVPSAQSYNNANAAWLADAALLAYSGPTAQSKYPAKDLVEFEMIDAGATQCHIAHYPNFAIVAFRGTQPNQFRDVLFDAHFEFTRWNNTSLVHGGFQAALDQIWLKLEAALNRATAAGRQMWFTGHSLGAALAVLAADRFQSTAGVYTFGCPRVGDEAFAKNFSNRFRGRSFRFVNALDVVAAVPPEIPNFIFEHPRLAFPNLLHLDRYRHVTTGRQIDNDGKIIDRETSAGFGDLLVRFGGQLLKNLITLRDGRLLQDGEVLPPYLYDHMPRAYAVRAWNDV